MKKPIGSCLLGLGGALAVTPFLLEERVFDNLPILTVGVFVLILGVFFSVVSREGVRK